MQVSDASKKGRYSILYCAIHMSSKICSKCGKQKDVDRFSKNKDAPDGLSYQCKACHKEYYNENKIRIAERGKAWRTNNAEQYQEYRRNYDITREKGITGKLRAMLRGSRKRAKEKGLVHTLKLKDLHALYVTHCPITGDKISWETGLSQSLSYNPLGPSLDRTNSSEGYTPSNVRIVSHQGNTWKNNMSLSDAIKVVQYLQSVNQTAIDN
jgi:hypothetical protein